MDNAARLSAERFRIIYEESFKVWSNLYHRAIKDPSLPTSYLSLPDLFRLHPFFPNDLTLKHAEYTGFSRVYATGSSIWGSQQTTCDYGLPSFQRQVEIDVVAQHPVLLSIVEISNKNLNFAPWFINDQQNYLAVLVLAWTYILSARWVEVMPEPCSLLYTNSSAADYDEDSMTSSESNQNVVSVDIGDVSSEEFRWWAAILAPEPGWQATMILRENIFLSPWSIRLQSGPRFSLLYRATSSAPLRLSQSAPSFRSASRFLHNFCVKHNIADQSYAALAAVILFPTMKSRQPLQLPAPTIDNSENLTMAMSSQISQEHLHNEHQLGYEWMCQGNHLDRLLTLSCNVRGIRSMLLSTFYDINIECNAVTPWLQGAVAAIESLASDKPLVLGRMFMERSPQLSFLWLGITVLGLQEKVLQDVRWGLIPIDLHSSVWSGTVQSFLQQPVSYPLVVKGSISRADECRLLFLSQSGFHSRVPLCQWKPFGNTLLEDTDLEVRIHAECKGHGLQYNGFFWDCITGEVPSQPMSDISTHAPPVLLPPRDSQDIEKVNVDYTKLDREEESISENATRNIFGWLRIDGYASCEKEIWESEWWDILDSDDDYEVDEGESNPDSRRGPSSRVKSWILELSN
ncbi:hypothetical protein F5Y00DRAFT_269722 [Daldinia vernicosa]|uniref:uncharacterized protein n=1 Tax=Daldinia vernicosa TaxID=114800 RepID=UPI0020089D16|nr:uncharacterized protein F5Y00DRAFT_269722 [Daldinia vernicosa]KAI0849092.1 hypothetical protein F5Y00DRAFT_269722 [Daldinia vernicosa]